MWNGVDYCYIEQCYSRFSEVAVAHSFSFDTAIWVLPNEIIVEGNFPHNIIVPDNGVTFTGASDVWQDGDNFYALIATATEVAIYDLKKNTDDKIEMQDADAIYAVAAVTVGTGTGASTTAAAMVYDNDEMPAYYEDYSETIRVLIYNVDLSFSFGYNQWKYVYLKAPATTTTSNTLAFDTTGNYLLATFDNEWALMSSDFDTYRPARILHRGSATSNVQVAFSPSPDTFKTASGGTIAAGIFKQLYVVATKDKLEWHSVTQNVSLASINSLNTAGDDIVSVQWLTQHEVVLFRLTSGRQHVPVPGKVFNVDRDDVAGAIDNKPCSAMDASLCSTYDVVCPVTCSSSVLDVDHYANQNQGLQKLIYSSTKSCTTIDCNILDTAAISDTAQLQNGALVAQFLCPETCKAPLAYADFGTMPYISVEGACDESGINGVYELIGGMYVKTTNANFKLIPNFDSNAIILNEFEGTNIPTQQIANSVNFFPPSLYAIFHVSVLPSLESATMADSRQTALGLLSSLATGSSILSI